MFFKKKIAVVFHFFGGRLPFFILFLSLSSIYFLGVLSYWVKIRLHTENQLPRLPGSALKVPVGGVGWLPTHYQVKLQLKLRLSWAVTTTLVGVVL